MPWRSAKKNSRIGSIFNLWLFNVLFIGTEPILHINFISDRYSFYEKRNWRTTLAHNFNFTHHTNNFQKFWASSMVIKIDRASYLDFGQGTGVNGEKVFLDYFQLFFLSYSTYGTDNVDKVRIVLYYSSLNYSCNEVYSLSECVIRRKWFAVSYRFKPAIEWRKSGHARIVICMLEFGWRVSKRYYLEVRDYNAL